MQYPTISEYVKASQDAGDNLDMSTEATNAELNEAITDEFDVKYSKDERKILRAPQELNGTYSIKEGVRIICNWAFGGCRSLSSVVIPDSVVCINGNPFGKWYGKLECLSPYFIYEDEVLFNKDKSKIISCRAQGISSYIIPDSVTSIGSWAFSGCESLRSVVIPTSVTSIGRGAFRDSNLPVNLQLNLISRFGKNICVTFYPYP